MANLNIRNIDEGLKAEVKAAAAMAQMTLSEFCTMIFRDMNFREVGKKIGVYKGVADKAQDKKIADVGAGGRAQGMSGAEVVADAARHFGVGEKDLRVTMLPDLTHADLELPPYLKVPEKTKAELNQIYHALDGKGKRNGKNKTARPKAGEANQKDAAPAPEGHSDERQVVSDADPASTTDPAGRGLAGPGFQHDTANCRTYGCLMCKAAKEGK